MGRVFPDISPLRESPAFRLLWFGQIISMTGSMVRFVAIPYQIYLLTGSPLAVGLIGLFQAVPTIVLSLFGGVIADRVDRRRLLIVTQVCLTATSIVLAVATQLGVVSVPFLYALTAVGASFSALDSPPARRSSPRCSSGGRCRRRSRSTRRSSKRRRSSVPRWPASSSRASVWRPPIGSTC